MKIGHMETTLLGETPLNVTKFCKSRGHIRDILCTETDTKSKQPAIIAHSMYYLCNFIYLLQ